MPMSRTTSHARSPSTARLGCICSRTAAAPTRTSSSTCLAATRRASSSSAPTTTASPGADDNGSALAVLLELARAFAEAPLPRAISLVAFDLEEQDLVGSRAYAAALHGRREPLRLMLALEMLG